MAAATKEKGAGADATGLHVVAGPDTPEDDAAVDAMNATPDVEKPGDDARSIEDLADETKPVAPMQIAIPGTGERISLTAGGAMPTSSEFRVVGGRVPVEGQFTKGDIVRLVVEVKVGEVGFVDTTDDWGNVQKTVRVHKGRMLSVTRLPS